ncbi:MAG: hypothetical protein Q4D16_10785 [Eubacteriales bacterium]|nr:hypothetical protein [Eubacteriales bacterium]
MFKEAQKYFLLVCVLFAVTTFCSSIFQLTIQEKGYDSNTHILLRGAICILGVGFICLFRTIKLRNKLLQECVHYIVSLFLIILFIFCLSFFVEIGENPPYPIFALNYTGVYAVITAVSYFNEKKKRKDKEQ